MINAGGYPFLFRTRKRKEIEVIGKGRRKKKKLRNTLRLKNSSTSLLPQRLLPLLRNAEALAVDPQDFKETQDRLFPKDFFDTVVK